MFDKGIKDTETDRVNYGIITKYNGGGGKCAVNILLSTGFQEFPNISLKGSLVNRKLGQKLALGSLVMVDDGTIVLVYKPNEHSAIDPRSLEKLTGVIADDVGFDEEDEYALPPVSEDEDDICFASEGEEEEEEVDIDSL